MSDIAHRLFEVDDDDESAAKQAEADLIVLLQGLGIQYDGLGWDWYDGSLELYGMDPDFRLSEETRAALFDAGFFKVYVNHTDKWETHYSSRDSTGWRVSYPHKRDDGSSGVWVEKMPESWPKKWLKTGYAIIKNALPTPKTKGE